MNPDAAHHQSEAIRLASSGRLHDAIQHFERARQLDPSNAVLHYNCGFAWHQMNRLAEAADAYRQAIELAPDFFDAWNNLSAALKAADQIDVAVTAARQAVALRPNASTGFLNLGNALKANGDWPGAESAYRSAVALEPANPRNQLNLANTLRELGRLNEAMPLFYEAVRTNPSFAEAHRDLAFALFLSGNLEAGWPENEWRWQTAEMASKQRCFDHPRWSGDNLAGRTLLVYTEQGFGDAIQFVRYLDTVVARGGRVVLECQPALARLFRSMASVNELVVRGEPLPAFDCHIPLLSLPGVFRTSVQTIPARVPYLSAPSEAVKRLTAALPISPRPKVGLVWAGNRSHLNDRNRSISVEQLRPLLDLPGLDFVSLQVGDRADEAKGLKGRATEVIELSGCIGDYADTAAIVHQLDLIISVDTSVAHLAGAMSKPTWLLLPFAPDWRWMLEREDSPWYPTMSLLRQPRPGDWSAVIQRVREALVCFK